MIYLASPYTDQDEQVMHLRFKAAEHCTASLLKKRMWVYSPIVHCHQLAQEFDLPKDFEFWKAYNFAMLRHASGMGILKISGWDISKGVTEERKLAKTLGLPTYFFTPDGVVTE